MALSAKAIELIQKARIVSFAAWQDSHPVESIERFRAADDQSRYLTDRDLEQIQQLVPSIDTFIPVVQQLRDRVSEIVDEARADVFHAFPNITKPGGTLSTRTCRCLLARFLAFFALHYLRDCRKAYRLHQCGGIALYETSV